MSGNTWRKTRSAALGRVAATIAALGLCPLPLARGEAAGQATAIGVLDFDYRDTSGEPKNQKAEHESRLRDFVVSLRRDLEQGGAFKVVALDCGAEPCSVKQLTPEELFEAGRRAGARLLLYGGIHKISTLVQVARVQVVDIEKNIVVDDRRLSFRGDDDQAWRRAEAFIVKQMKEQSAR